MSGTGTSGNVVAGNLIGTDATGNVSLGNEFGGMQLDIGATGNTIGGTASGAGNVISGNSQEGILLEDADNLVAGNEIGTNSARQRGPGKQRRRYLRLQRREHDRRYDRLRPHQRHLR